MTPRDWATDLDYEAGQALCRLLHLEPRDVVGITITANPGHPITATVDHIWWRDRPGVTHQTIVYELNHDLHAVAVKRFAEERIA